MGYAHCMLDNYGYKCHTGCVILIVFLLQQRLHKRSSVLRYTYIDCVVECEATWCVKHVVNFKRLRYVVYTYKFSTAKVCSLCLGWDGHYTYIHIYIYIHIYTVQGNEGDRTFLYRCLYLSTLGHFALSETLDCPFEINLIISALTNELT